MAHEIGPATHCYAYIWGRGARAFFRLAADGHLVASNLHADMLDETCMQPCDENGVDPAHLAAVTLRICLGREHNGRSMRRWIRRVYEHDGETDRLLWEGRRLGDFTQHAESARISRSGGVLHRRRGGSAGARSAAYHRCATGVGQLGRESGI